MLEKHQKKQLSDLGANIRRERTRRNLTQAQLAELVELNIRTVQKIEAGETNILATTLMRFQKALGCSFNRLLPSE